MVARVTVESLHVMKRRGEPITGLGAFDYPTGLLIDRAGLDIVLVGDSLGQHALGLPRIEATTMEHMIHHCSAVTRGVQRALVIGDMPFGSYEVSPVLAVENAVRLVKEGGVDAVKVEGGREVTAAVQSISAAHIPVFGHLTPVHAGGSPASAHSALVEAACAVEDAGASAVVLVDLDPETAHAVTRALHIPTIGYRSGPYCDGQLLVTAPMLGLSAANDFAAGPYGALGNLILEAFERFRRDIAGD